LNIPLFKQIENTALLIQGEVISITKEKKIDETRDGIVIGDSLVVCIHHIYRKVLPWTLNSGDTISVVEPVKIIKNENKDKVITYPLFEGNTRLSIGEIGIWNLGFDGVNFRRQYKENILDEETIKILCTATSTQFQFLNAIIKGDLRLMQMIVENNNIDLSSDFYSYPETNPLIIVGDLGMVNSEVIEYLLQNGCADNVKKRSGKNFLDLISDLPNEQELLKIYNKY